MFNIRVSVRPVLGRKPLSRCIPLLLAAILGLGAFDFVSDASAANLRLRVSSDRRFLEKSDGTPFFWMGETAWFLPKLSTTDIDLYLSDAAQKGFNGALIDLGYYYFEPVGTPPFIANDPDRPNETYWQKVDWMVSRADAYGIYTALVVMWGYDYPKAFGTDTAKAYRFGRWLGQRYGNRNNVLWVVSGEYTAINQYSPTITTFQKSFFEQMARGIRDGGGSQLMSIHPGSAVSSSSDFQNSWWLDFNLIQSGHVADLYRAGTPENHQLVARDYSLFPTKPVMDGEPAYEGMIDGALRFPVFDINTRIGSDVTRRKAYWAVFAGAFGHTYGHSALEVFNIPGERYPYYSNSIWSVLIHWKQALTAPGRVTMRHLRALVQSRPLAGRVPDQTILASDPGVSVHHARAIRSSNGSYGWIYIPTGGAVTINMAKFTGPQVQASWYSPRDGSKTAVGGFANSSTRVFDAPGATAIGNDWVLVLEGANGTSVPTPPVNSTPPVSSTPPVNSTPPVIPPVTSGNPPVSGLTTALRGYWKFDEGSGNFPLDSSGNGNTGALVNGPVWAQGRTGSALSFDGVNDHVSLGNPAGLQITGAMTVAAWVNTESIRNGRIVAKTAGMGMPGWSLNVESYNVFEFSIAADQNRVLHVDTTTGVPLNTWVHVVGVYEPGSALRIYVNGRMNNSLTGNIPMSQFNSTAPAQIGARADGSGGGRCQNCQFDGRIDEVRVYNRALTPTEVQQLYAATP